MTIVISTVAGICFFLNSLITRRFWVVPVIALLISGVLVSTLSTSSSSIIQAILIALFFGLPSGMAGRVLGMQKTIQITESKQWSLKMTLFGIILGLSFGLLVAVLSSENKLVRGLEAGLPLGLFLMLILGRESIGTLQDRKGSSKKILQATRRGLRMGGIVTFVIILIGTIIGSLEGNVILGLSFALFIASPIGLAVALISGGAAALRHGLLRLILLRQGVIPFYLTDFLNYAVYLAFLRNVGSGYVFIHTWLLDYFAGLTTQSNEA